MLLLVAVETARAQIIELRGGSSSLFRAHGGSLQIYASRYTGEVSIGLLDRPRVGFLVRTPQGHFIWSAGDQMIPFVLPTDTINRSYAFWGRGLSAARKDTRSNLLLYAGATSTGFLVPFLSAARAEKPTALAFYERQLRPSLRFSSRNIVSSRQTSIQSFEWQVREDLKLAFAGGLGNNQGYGASSLDFHRKWISLQSSYARAGRDFRRVRLESPLVAETDRENIQLDLVPLRNLRFSASRQNFLTPASVTSNARATVNSLGSWATVRGFQFRGSLFEASNSGRRLHGLAVGGGHSFGNRLATSIDYLRSAPAGGPVSSSVVASLSERLTRRFGLSQTINRSAGRTSIAYGGSLLTNMLNISAEYQTIFLPFAPADQSPFKQVLALNVQLQLPRNLTLVGTTSLNLVGKVRYTAYMTAFAYGGQGGERGSPWPRKVFPKYIIRGQVIDEAGQPVIGAALGIDGELVFSDSRGFFFLRRDKAKQYRLRVLLDQFMLPGRYQVLIAPATVDSVLEDAVQVYRVELQRLPLSIPKP